MRQWEYQQRTEKAISFDANNTIEKFLNIMGKQGWELITIIPVNKLPPYSTYYEFFFKREKETK